MCGDLACRKGANCGRGSRSSEQCSGPEYSYLRINDQQLGSRALGCTAPFTLVDGTLGLVRTASAGPRSGARRNLSPDTSSVVIPSRSSTQGSYGPDHHRYRTGRWIPSPDARQANIELRRSGPSIGAVLLRRWISSIEKTSLKESSANEV